ncbi:MAG: ABC transporter permease [Candidatus Dadabacteria bacterium]|nr:MAG: ABC transporter permease [Candidatus Dadabacteria bacterium]
MKAFSARAGLLLGLAFRNMLRNPRRSILTLSAISVGVWSCTSLAALARGVGAEMARDAIYNLTGHIQIHAPDYVEDPSIEHRFKWPNQKINRLLKEIDTAGIAVRVRVPAVVASERETRSVTLVGIDPAQEQGLSFIGDKISAGDLFSAAGKSGIVIGRALLDELETKQGKRVVLLSQNTKNEIADRGFRITAVFDAELESTEKSYVFVSREAAQTMLGMQGEVSEIAVTLKDKDKLHEYVTRLKQALPEFEVHSWRELEPLVTALNSIQNGFLFLWYLIVIVTVAFGLVNTLFMAIYERTYEIGLTQAIGFSPLMVLFEVVFESFYLLISGAIIGNILALLTNLWLKDGVDVSAFARGTEMIGVSSMIYPDQRISDLVAVNILVLIIGIAGSVYPAWRASRLTPVEAMGRRE